MGGNTKSARSATDHFDLGARANNMNRVDDPIERFQQLRKYWLTHCGYPGLVLLFISVLCCFLQGSGWLRVPSCLIGVAMIWVFGWKVRCPFCAKMAIGKHSSWNPDRCYTCNAPLKPHIR